MKTYSARVSFTVLDFQANNAEEAEDYINLLLDELGDVGTTLAWDDVDWELTEGE